VVSTKPGIRSKEAKCTLTALVCRGHDSVTAQPAAKRAMGPATSQRSFDSPQNPLHPLPARPNRPLGGGRPQPESPPLVSGCDRSYARSPSLRSGIPRGVYLRQESLGLS